MRVALLFFVFVLAGACADPAPKISTDALPDGVYEVLAVESDREALPSADEGTRVLVFDRQFLADGDELPPEYVLLRIQGHAPLALAKPPAAGEAHGRPALLLNLDEDAGKALQALTTRAKRAAVVVNDTIVTVHRIRVPIEGGGLQVSC